MLNKLSPEQKKSFQSNINMAFILAMVADGFMARAENVVREKGAYRIDVKKNMERAVKELSNLTIFVDKVLTVSEPYFYADVKFIDELMQWLIDNCQDEQQKLKFMRRVKDLTIKK